MNITYNEERKHAAPARCVFRGMLPPAFADAGGKGGGAVERLQKIIAARGVCSRRKAEELIRAGRVCVNGAPAAIGASAQETDEITIDGKKLAPVQTYEYFMLNKPEGVLTTSKDDRGRKTVLDLLPRMEARVYPVGRLDYFSGGLLLLTNDGALTYALTHPKHNVTKEYVVRVGGMQDDSAERLARPMEIDGYMIHPALVRVLSRDGTQAEISITIHEGRNRQVRKMCAACGLQVRTLNRVAIGRLRLGGLARGRCRRLTSDEVSYLKGLCE